MSAPHHHRIRDCFERLVEMAPAQRAEALIALAREDTELHATVRALLEHHDRTVGSPPLPALARGAQSPAAMPHGATLERDDAQRIVGARYRIESDAKSGGMGRVYRATDTVLQRAVAIKFLHPLSSVDSDAERDRILREARAMARLRHPGLCPIHEVELAAEVPFLVMEWSDGLPLDVAIERLPLPARLDIFARLVDAVAEMHRAGLVHGDLKPANVLVDRSGLPIVVDFGLSARIAGGASGLVRGGTPGYSPPEQFETTQPWRPEMDVYAIGVILYRLITGRAPFADDSPARVVTQMRTSDPPLPEEFAPDAPWALQRIVLVAMERDPQRRYPDATALGLDLRRFMRGETVAARPSMLAESFRERVESHLADVERWRKQGLVVDVEANRLSRLLSGILRPESHWILDARRLTVSQVTLYLGGWFVTLALSVGVVMSWEALDPHPAARYLLACVTITLLIGVGVALQRRGEARFGVGFQMTGCLLVPIAAWLLLGETEFLSNPLEGRELMEVFPSIVPPVGGLLNRQLLVIGSIWLAVAALLRRIASTSAMTPFAVLAAMATAIAAWASTGFLSDDDRNVAWFGLWLATVGAVAIGPALRVDAIEHRHGTALGWNRARQRDAWSILAGALVMLMTGLTVAAWHGGDLYTLGLRSDPTDPTTRAWAFIGNGIALQMVAHVIGRRRTILRDRTGEWIRWITPAHFLTALSVLQVEAEEGMRLVWIVTLAAAAALFAYLSIVRQWKPFLFAGLAYLAVAYVLAYREAWMRFDNEDALRRVQLGLLVLVLLAGFAMMVGAWLGTGWRRGILSDRSMR